MTRPSYLSDESIDNFIDAALKEDIGKGDFTTLGSVDKDQQGRASLLVKEDGRLAGVELATRIFHRFDKELQVDLRKKDGEEIRKGEVAFVVSGHARSILSTERVVLNCLQRMSGIATYTHRLCLLLEGTQAKLMDTRKTTPNFRLPEKWAVAIGGGENHRFALYDMVMLKDNHVDLAGGVAPAISRMRKFLLASQTDLKIEIETRNLREVKEAVETGAVDVIMLDNMSVGDMKQAVALIGGKCKTEASGGITESTMRTVAECGVDYISVGALTHSVKSLDLSLKIMKAAG